MKYAAVLLKGMATAGVLLALIACLNPLGNNPNFKLNLDVRAKVNGELLTDNINSAEVQIQNHTLTVDINLVNIEVSAWSTEDRGGVMTPVQTKGIAARITGGPHTESRESVLLRPILKNPASEKNDVYELTIKYKRAAGEKADKYYTDHPVAPQEGTKTLMIDDLPRGKYIIHVYRNIGSDIEISVDPVDENTKDSTDFTNNFNVNNYINGLDFSGITFNANSNTTVDFSDEFKAQFKALSDGSEAIVNAINNLGMSFNRFPKGYAPVIVYNHTKHPATLEWTMKDTAANTGITERTGSLGPIGAYDQDAVLLRAENYAGKVISNGTESSKTIPLLGMKQAYIHIYKTKSGGVDFAVTDNSSYWTLDTIKAISNINVSYLSPKFDKPTAFVIKNSTGSKDLEVFIVNDFDGTVGTHLRDVRIGDTSVSLKVSELAYNHNMIIRSKDTGAVNLERGIVILPGDWPLARDTNIYVIKEEPLPPAQDINWTITADGGPGNASNAADSDPGYDTRKLTVVFTAPVSGVTFGLGSAKTPTGIWTTTDNGTTWTASYHPFYNNGQYEDAASVPAGTYKKKINATAFVEEWTLLTAASGDARDTIGKGSKDATVYSHRMVSVTPIYQSRYFYVNGGIAEPEGILTADYDPTVKQDTKDLQRYTEHKLKWFFTYEERKYMDGIEIDSTDRPRTTINQTTHPKFAALDIDASVKGNDKYCKFLADGTFWVGKGGKDVSNPFLAYDDKPAQSGYRWRVQSGVIFSGEVVDGKKIENMPSGTVDLFFLYWKVGKTTKQNYKALDIWTVN